MPHWEQTPVRGAASSAALLLTCCCICLSAKYCIGRGGCSCFGMRGVYCGRGRLGAFHSLRPAGWASRAGWQVKQDCFVSGVVVAAAGMPASVLTPLIAGALPPKIY